MLRFARRSGFYSPKFLRRKMSKGGWKENFLSSDNITDLDVFSDILIEKKMKNSFITRNDKFVIFLNLF